MKSIHPKRKLNRKKLQEETKKKKNNFGAELQTVCGPYERFGN
jgi:hypothetical protein